jgi:hypothetical protein
MRRFSLTVDVGTRFYDVSVDDNVLSYGHPPPSSCSEADVQLLEH